MQCAKQFFFFFVEAEAYDFFLLHFLVAPLKFPPDLRGVGAVPWCVTFKFMLELTLTNVDVA